MRRTIPFLAAVVLFAPAVLLAAACGGTTDAGAGTAAAGKLEAPETLDFGVVGLGDTGTRTLSLRNTGPGALVIDAVELAPPFAAAPVLPVALGPGDTSAVTVSFAPETAGPVSGVARIRAGDETHEVQLGGVGGESPLRCEPAAIDLGRPVAGSVRTFAVSCANTGDLPLAVSTRGPDDVVSSSSEPVTVPPGGAPVSFEFRYRPAGLAPLDASLRFVSGTATLAAVHVSAAPIATAIAWTDALACPRGLDLGFAMPGTTASRTFSFRNTGDAPVAVTGVAIEGPFTVAPAPPFAVPPDDPATAADEGRAELTVTFAPTATGAAGGTLRLAFDDAGTPEGTGCLSAYGGGPVPACRPAAIDFGPVASCAPRTVAVVCDNEGVDVPGTEADRLHLVASASGAGFSVHGTPPAGGLGAGEATTFEVVFTPVADGPASGVLAIATLVPSLPRIEVPLAGDGFVLAPCEYRVEPAAVAFGPVAAGGTPAELAVTIVNEGDDGCLVRDLGLEPGTSPALALPGNSGEPVVIPAAGSLAVPVRFTPDGGAAAGALSFSISSAGGADEVVDLSGSTAAAEPCLRIYPESVDFGEVGPGCASLVATIDVINTCSAPARLADVSWVGPAGPFRVTPPVAGAVVNPGLGATVQVEYRPTMPGEHLAGLRVTSTAEPGTRLVPIRGRATAPSGSETFPPEPAAIDVLLVMDNSGGTGAEQYATAVSLPSLFAAATAWNLDWQFGVTTTGLASPCGNPGGAGGAEDGRLFPVDNSRPRIVRPSTPNALDVAAANVRVGECHYDEQGMEGAFRALTPPVIDHADDPRHPEANDGNLGFLRPGARLAVIEVTDEADQSPGTVTYYDRAMGGVKRERWREHRFVGHAVTGDPGTGCGSAFGNCEPGDKLVAWSAATGGGFVSSCSIDWVAEFERLGLEVFGRTHFYLKGRPSGWPSPSTSDLRIFVDGLPWQGPASGWRWDATANAVVFDPAWAPAPTETVEFRYAPRCVAPAP